MSAAGSASGGASPLGGSSPGDDPDAVEATDHLSLADWRRRVADLYASVREMASGDPRAAWGHWRAVRDNLFRTHPQSPVPAADRPAFMGRYWPYDPALRFEVQVSAAEESHGGLLVDFPISIGDALSFKRIGKVEIPFDPGPRILGLFWMAGYAGGLFLPFRDTTNGGVTYGAGRYLLDTAKSADLGGEIGGDGLTIDFNFSYHPSCAFDPKWSCPLAPPENRLDRPIEAGERLR